MNGRLSAFIVILAICVVLPLVSVALRFWSRSLIRGRKFWWDDWLALAALPVFIVEAAISLIGTNRGFGQHAWEISDAELREALQLLFAGEILYAISISIPKLSVLCLYARIFSAGHSRFFRPALWTIGGLVLAWCLSAVLSTIFQCTPMEKAWVPTDSGHCLNIGAWYLGTALANVILDIMILLLPVPILWRLKMEKTKRLLVILVFACGYLVIVFSIGRLISVLVQGKRLNTDITWNFIPVGYFVELEPAASITSVCLPNIFQLLRRAKRYGFQSLFTASNPNEDALVVKPHPSSKSTSGRSRGFSRLQSGRDRDLSAESELPITSYVGSKAEATGQPVRLEEEGIEMDDDVVHQIQVRREIDVEEHVAWSHA